MARLAEMIYIYEAGEYEERQIEAVFEGPAGLRVDLVAFLESLGLRPPPAWPEVAIQAAEQRDKLALTGAYQADRRAWEDERAAVLKAKAIYRREDAAHLAWLRERPELRELKLESDFELI